MRRRNFVGGLIGVAVWPTVGSAQHMPLIGFLNGQASNTYSHLAAAFRRGLREAGFVNGQNATIEYRWANGREDRLPGLAAELVERNVTVLVSSGGLAASLAATKITKMIPIVFLTGSDPVKYGLVSSINQPGGNVTGISFLVNQLNAKRFEVATRLIPNTRVVGFLSRPSNPARATDIREVQNAASALGTNLMEFQAESVQEVEKAFGRARSQDVSIMLVHTDPFFNANRVQLVAAANKHAVPALYELREFVVEGGLASYGTNIVEAYRQAGAYAGRIIKGEKPGDLPVQQSSRFELAINLKTAKSLGVVIPQNMLVAADEVIE
jgi:putative ABC transport system substrate-binding protein